MPTYARPKNADSIEVDYIRSTAAAAIILPNGVKVDTVSENTLNAGVTLDGVLLKDSLIAQSAISLAWSNWTPTYFGINSMTFTPVTTNFAKYIQLGNLIIWQLSATGTIGGTLDTAVGFSAPVNFADVTSGYENCGSGLIFDGGDNAAIVFRNALLHSILVKKYNSANFSSGSGKNIICSGMYRA